MRSLFEDKKIFLVGGPGGVGKTTLAAAMGVQLARQGYKTVVLTVDPARRLAQALGFEGFNTELQEVAVPSSPQGTSGTLHASMLDTQRYFDRIIERFATQPNQRERILKNPLYRIMVDSLGGTHEYAAMERLLEFATDDRFDRIVIDTPPSQNAVDLLSAPQRLADFMDNSVLKWFQGKKPYLSLLRTGTKLAMKMLKMIFGAEFLDSFAKFMDDLEGMQAGFRSRNLEVLELLRSPRAAFLLVTYPSEVRFLESIAFLETLKETKIPLSAILLNRVEGYCPPAHEVPSLKSLPPPEQVSLSQFLDFANGVYQRQQHWVQKFKETVPALPLFSIEKEGDDPHDVTTLCRLSEFLVK